MANQNEQNQGAEADGLSGSEVQQSQAGGGSGEFGGNRDQQQSGQAGHGGQQMGGGANQSDFAQAGGSSGTGGYGNAQNQENHQGQDGLASYGTNPEQVQSRGERFDEQQGGGRGADSVSGSDDLQQDQQEHQDRGQSAIEAEREQG